MHEPQEAVPSHSPNLATQILKQFHRLDNFVDLGNPVVLLLVVYLTKKILDTFNNVSNTLLESLWFSQKKDIEIICYLQLMRETLGCDRAVLGLIVNGERSVGNNYHLRKLVITHESCGFNIASAIKNREARFSLAVLTKENALYTEGKNWVTESITNENLDKSCRRYLDSIETHTIYTIKLQTKINDKQVDMGYLSFQWCSNPKIAFLDTEAIDFLLNSSTGRDSTFYCNRIITTVMSSSDRRNLFLGIGEQLRKLVGS